MKKKKKRIPTGFSLLVNNDFPLCLDFNIESYVEESHIKTFL